MALITYSLRYMAYDQALLYHGHVAENDRQLVRLPSKHGTHSTKCYFPGRSALRIAMFRCSTFLGFDRMSDNGLSYVNGHWTSTNALLGDQ